MEVQVKVLELEQALEVERMRLSALRKQNYQSMEWFATWELKWNQKFNELNLFIIWLS